MTFDLDRVVNPRVLTAPRYNLQHVAVCWEREGELVRALSNESAYPPLASVQEAICEVASKANWYAEDPCECIELRTKLAAYTSLQPENITLGNGSMELLDILFQTFVGEPGVDEVIMPAPDYSAYTIRARLFGPRVWLAIGGEDSSLIADGMLSAISPRTKFVLLSRPNNPTGKVMASADIERLLRAGVVTVVDEAYVELADEGTTVAPWIREWPNLIVMRTFSKAFGLAGLRLGYLLASPEVITYANRVRHAFNVNLVAIAAALASLNDMDNVRARISELCQTRDWLTAELARMPGLRPIPSQGNFVLVDVAESGKKAKEFVDGLFERGVFVRDFSTKKGLEPDRYFRITVGLPEDMKRLVAALSEMLAAGE